MSWRPLPRGRFTGIDWSAPGAIDGMDPYLAWAEADDFGGYRVPGAHPHRRDWLPVVIGLRPGADVAALVHATDPAWLQVPAVYLAWPGLRHCTARVSRAFFRHWRRRAALRALIERFELGLPVGHHADALHGYAAPHGAPPAPLAGRLRGPVLGLIDGGLAVANAAFLDPEGRTRVRHFWRQDDDYGGPWPGTGGRHRVPLDPARAGPVPPDLGYGHALTGAAIDAAMRAHRRHGRLDEDALYRHLQLWDLSRPVSHGTHVAGLAAAPGGLLDPARNDAASRCPIVAVQLDQANVRDTSGGALNVSVLDGLHYIVSRCADDAAIVVNISWGALGGPHDGSSLLEAAMDELVAALCGRLQIVLPAGNAYQARTHANAVLAPRTRATDPGTTLHWRVPPDDHTQSFLELWLPDGAEEVTIEVRPPHRPTQAVRLGPGGSGLWTDDAGRAEWSLIYPRRSALGAHGSGALLALAPTAGHDRSRARAPFGVWTVTLRHAGTQPVVFDAYVERDDVATGTRTGARQSRLEDPAYDTAGNLDGWVDQPGNPSPVRRSGTFNGIATGHHTVAVGGTRRADAGPSGLSRFARYSPQRPEPDAARPQRPGVHGAPETLAACDDNTALWGVRSTGSLSGSTVRLVGTSAAAPREARRRLNRLA